MKIENLSYGTVFQVAHFKSFQFTHLEFKRIELDEFHIISRIFSLNLKFSSPIESIG